MLVVWHNGDSSATKSVKQQFPETIVHKSGSRVCVTYNITTLRRHPKRNFWLMYQEKTKTCSLQ